MGLDLHYTVAPTTSASVFLPKVPRTLRMPLFGDNVRVFGLPNVVKTGAGTVVNSRIKSRRV